MKRFHVVALLGILGGSCSLNLADKNACVTSADCFGGLTCVNARCGHEQPGSSNDAGSKNDGGGPTTDGPRAHRDASSDLPDGRSDRVDSSTNHPDGSSDRHDGAGDRYDARYDGSLDGHSDASDHRDASPDRGSADHADASSNGDAAATCSPGTRPIRATCDVGTVNACPVFNPASTTQCQQTYCGGRLWRSGSGAAGYIPYRIRDPKGLFSDAYKDAIRAGAAAWSAATGGLITFGECSNCSGRFISVIPGTGDGVDESPDWEQLMPLPVDPEAPNNISSHRIAHQWGHAIGLDDTYRRPDRDSYVSFDGALWCWNCASLPAICARSGASQQPGSPSIASGTFGAFDDFSVMNGLGSEGVCDHVAAAPDSGGPTLGDVSAVEELYYGATGPWSPFQPIARSVGPRAPLDYELAPGVDPIGGPAIAEWTAPSVDIVVRGTDGNVYETWNDLVGNTFLDWAPWTVVANQVNADPAVVFSGPTTLHLVVRSAQDGSIRLRTRTAGTWGSWASLGAPPVGAASAPTITASDDQLLTVIVRGSDNALYRFECTDPAKMCAASAASEQPWTALPTPPLPFLGKPSVTWVDGQLMMVTAIGADHNDYIIGGGPDNWGVWLSTPGVLVAPDDPDPGLAVTSNDILGNMYHFVRDSNGLLMYKLDGSPTPIELGGLLVSAPSAVATRHGAPRVDVVALIDDHGHPGVWWKFLSSQTTPPCNYNAPGMCGQCGCGFPGAPPCDR